ncbi:hypothetical protein LTR08_004954 [Meristemomyces frigidus]|nr:hypothetical protein LTR08_004954 [Meristemomyces frigidus]
MPSIMVSLKENASPDQLADAKKKITDQGGKITNEFTLIKGFSAELPEGQASILSSNEHLNVENDGEVKTQ